jgi:archaellum component FlaF (FlaF/FlaG flagellin family)
MDNLPTNIALGLGAAILLLQLFIAFRLMQSGKRSSTDANADFAAIIESFLEVLKRAGVLEGPKASDPNQSTMGERSDPQQDMRVFLVSEPDETADEDVLIGIESAGNHLPEKKDIHILIDGRVVKSGWTLKSCAGEIAYIRLQKELFQPGQHHQIQVKYRGNTVLTAAVGV